MTTTGPGMVSLRDKVQDVLAKHSQLHRNTGDRCRKLGFDADSLRELASMERDLDTTEHATATALAQQTETERVVQKIDRDRNEDILMSDADTRDARGERRALGVLQLLIDSPADTLAMLGAISEALPQDLKEMVENATRSIGRAHTTPPEGSQLLSQAVTPQGERLRRSQDRVAELTEQLQNAETSRDHHAELYEEASRSIEAGQEAARELQKENREAQVRIKTLEADIRQRDADIEALQSSVLAIEEQDRARSEPGTETSEHQGLVDRNVELEARTYEAEHEIRELRREASGVQAELEERIAYLKEEAEAWRIQAGAAIEAGDKAGDKLEAARTDAHSANSSLRNLEAEVERLVAEGLLDCHHNVASELATLTSSPVRHDITWRMALIFTKPSQMMDAARQAPPVWDVLLGWEAGARPVPSARQGSIPEMLLELRIPDDLNGRLDAIRGLAAALARPRLCASVEMLDYLTETVQSICDGDCPFALKLATVQLMLVVSDRFSTTRSAQFCERFRASQHPDDLLVVNICADRTPAALSKLAPHLVADGAALVWTPARDLMVVLWHKKQRLLCVAPENVTFNWTDETELGDGFLSIGDDRIRLENTEQFRICARLFKLQQM